MHSAGKPHGVSFRRECFDDAQDKFAISDVPNPILSSEYASGGVWRE